MIDLVTPRNDEFSLQKYKDQLKNQVMISMADLKSEIEAMHEDMDTKLNEINSISDKFLYT